MRSADALLSENLVYSSEKIFERRRRILKTARELIAKRGYDGFNIRELCQRAKVAPQTVYKAFESKERLIALSLREHFVNFNDTHTYRHDKSTLAGVIERVIFSDNHMHDSRELVVALVSIFFSQTVDNELKTAAQLNILFTLQPWAEGLQQRGHLQPGVDVDGFVEAIVALLFNVTLEWCRGNIETQDFVYAKLQALLTYAAGAARGAGRKEIDAYLADLLGSRTLIAALRANVGRQRRATAGSK